MERKWLNKALVLGIMFLLIGINITSSTETNESKVQSSLSIEVFNEDETTIKIMGIIPEFDFASTETNNGEFTTLELIDTGFSAIPGEAKLPLIRRMVEIPFDSTPEITVTSVTMESTSLSQLGLPNRIIPAQHSVVKTPDAYVDFVIDEEYYQSNMFYPVNIANIADIGEIRGHRFALVEISPVQYNPYTSELHLITNCELQINLPGSDLAKTYENIERYSSQSFNELLKTMFANYGYYENFVGGGSKDSEGFIFIVYDDFWDELTPLTDWKASIGFDVTVQNTSTIPGGPTRDNIKLFIEDAYDNWDIPPAYVLLVGDVGQVPTYIGQSSYSSADLYYVTMNPEDYFPDIYIGRFPASQGSHVTAMVDKTLYYEQGSFPSTDWIKKAAFMAGNDNYWISEGTHNFVIDNYLDPNGYTCDKIYEVTYGGTTQDVTNALNDGRSLAIFSGHGSTYSWGDGPPFSQTNVRNLINEGMYPFVCSHACSTGTFNAAECFGETWVREADKAGLAFWGASASTYWDEDDWLEKGMFTAWWDEGLDWIGGMTDKGLYRVYENLSGGGLSRYYYEAYNVLGDPSVKLWSNDPSGNYPPFTPSDPNPIDDAHDADINTDLSWVGGDRDGDPVTYDVYFGTSVPPLKEVANQTDTIYDPGLLEYETTYYWQIIAHDDHDHTTEGPVWIFTTEEEPNQVPNIPDEPSGPTNGEVMVEYTYSTSTTDPNGDQVYYMFDWGDEISSWLGPYDSGIPMDMSHTWTSPGDYNVLVKAKDIYDSESDWSNVLAVTIAATFVRGDINIDGDINMEDAIHLLRHLYVPGYPELECMDAADTNDDGLVGMNDAFYLLRFIYAPGATEPPAPYPTCGVDPTSDDLDCQSHICFGG